MARQLFSLKQRKNHVTQWRNSGLSRRDYCHQQGIKESTFKNWLDRKIENSEPTFSPVTVKSTVTKHVTIETPKGFRIEIPFDETSDDLQQLFYTLGLIDAH